MRPRKPPPSATPYPLIVRKDTGLTQSQLAAVLGVSEVSISFWERGQAEPTNDKIEILRRLETLNTQVRGLVSPREFYEFLTAPHKDLDNYPPADLLRSAYASRRLTLMVSRLTGRPGPAGGSDSAERTPFRHPLPPYRGPVAEVTR